MRVVAFGCDHPSLYGHFGQGCVHTRIPFGLRTAEGVASFRQFVFRAADLVVSHGGSLSGEHGDGQARGELAASVPNLRHLEWFHDHVRLESRWFDGTLDPRGGHITPGADGAPGHGLTLRTTDAEPHRTG